MFVVNNNIYRQIRSESRMRNVMFGCATDGKFSHECVKALIILMILMSKYVLDMHLFVMLSSV